MKREHPSEAFERSIIERAEFFTAFLQIAPGDRINERCKDRPEAEAFAQSLADLFGKQAMIYAVSPEGRSAFVMSIKPKKEQKMSNPQEAGLDLAKRAIRGQLTAEERGKKKGKKASAVDAPPKTQTGGAGKKPPKRPAAPPIAQPRRQTAGAAEAEKGVLPAAPDFSAETHKRFRPKLAELQALVAAKDIPALERYPINPISTSPRALDRYRNLAVIALKAQAASEIL